MWDKANEMDVVLATEAKNHAHLLLRVHSARGIVGVGEHEHLHLLATVFRLLEGRLQNRLRDHVVALRRIGLDQGASVTQREVVVEGVVAGSDA